MKKKETRLILVRDDRRSFYRCIVTHGSVDLQNAKRRPDGSAEDYKLSENEEKWSDTVKIEVVTLLNSILESGQQLQQVNGLVDINLNGQPRKSHHPLHDRIRAISNSSGAVDMLEVLAVAYLAKTQVHFYQAAADIGYQLFAKYPPHVYSSRPPIVLVYQRDGGKLGREHFDVLLVKDKSRLSLSTSNNRNSFFEDCQRSATIEENSITFEQLNDPNLKHPVLSGNWVNIFFFKSWYCSTDIYEMLDNPSAANVLRR